MTKAELETRMKALETEVKWQREVEEQHIVEVEKDDVWPKSTPST